MVRCFLHALEHFGVVPGLALTSWCVATTWIAKVASDVRRFCTVVGLLSKLYRVRVPQTKGKVERGVGFMKNKFLPGRRFTSMWDLTRQGVAWCAEQDRRIHGTTGDGPAT